MRLEKYSYRYAEQVLNSHLTLKNEVEAILTAPDISLETLSRPEFNRVLEDKLVAAGWQRQPPVFDADDDASARLDFMKDRVGIEVQFGHSSFIGIDLLKFQVASYSALDKLDVGIYVTTTRHFQKHMREEHDQNWEGSLPFEKVQTYLPKFKSAIQVPLYVLGIDV